MSWRGVTAAEGGAPGGGGGGGRRARGAGRAADARLRQRGAVRQEGAVHGLLGAVHGARQGQLVGAQGDMRIEDDRPVRARFGEAAGGLFGHPAGHEQVHAPGEGGGGGPRGGGGGGGGG